MLAYFISSIFSRLVFSLLAFARAPILATGVAAVRGSQRTTSKRGQSICGSEKARFPEGPLTEGDNRSSLGSLLHQHVENFKRTQDWLVVCTFLV